MESEAGGAVVVAAVGHIQLKSHGAGNAAPEPFPYSGVVRENFIGSELVFHNNVMFEKLCRIQDLPFLILLISDGPLP